MAGKAKKTGKVAKKALKAPAKKAKPTPPYWNGDCTPENICKYLTQLNKFFWDPADGFVADYKKLRKAVCNLDYEVFGSGGNLADRFCTGGGATEPAAVEDPPKW